MIDRDLARFLCRLTSDFYANNSSSFSRTRQSAWPGWLTCSEVLRKEGLIATVCGVEAEAAVPETDAPEADAPEADAVDAASAKTANDGCAPASVEVSIAGRAEATSSKTDSSAPCSLSVLDLACGNMRFERFFSQVARPAVVHYCAVDSCDGLAACADGVSERYGQARGAGDASACDDQAQSLGCAASCGQSEADAATCGGSVQGLGDQAQVSYRKLDIMDALFSGKHLSGEIGASSCDLAVSFGFMHHIPLFEQRCMVLDSLIDSVRPGGFVAVSFWRFLHDESYAAKAQAEHEKAMGELGLPSLDEGDCILGWNGAQGAYRYCHSFSDAEIDRLAKCVAKRADVVARFCADGRTQEMNVYLVLRRREPPRAKPSGMIEMNEPFYQRVYEQVRRVPEGKVCTYGTIAKLAGYPRAAREVGLAMSRVQREWNLPCHRIVNAKGTLAPAHAFGGKENQRRLLESEGITFLDDGAIDMKRHWWPVDDELAAGDAAASGFSSDELAAHGASPAGSSAAGASGQLTLGF